MESVDKQTAEEYLESKTQKMWHDTNDYNHVITVNKAKEYALKVKREVIEGIIKEVKELKKNHTYVTSDTQEAFYDVIEILKSKL